MGGVRGASLDKRRLSEKRPVLSDCVSTHVQKQASLLSLLFYEATGESSERGASTQGTKQTKRGPKAVKRPAKVELRTGNKRTELWEEERVEIELKTGAAAKVTCSGAWLPFSAAPRISVSAGPAYRRRFDTRSRAVPGDESVKNVTK
jgi:hypothetical protein